MRILLRDQQPGEDVMNAHLNKGQYKSIPTVVLLDEDFKELGVWVERPESVTRLREEKRQALYKAHPSKPYAFPEWGLWGFDDPQFVRDMGKWLTTHKRIEFAAYFSGKPGSVWDLASKPQSRAAYRALITPLG